MDEEWHENCSFAEQERISLMQKSITLAAGRSGLVRYSDKIQVELVRKSIHILIGVVPTLASINLQVTTVLLGCGIFFYTYCEILRLRGYEVVVVTRVTSMASRRRDSGRFVLGPVTLGTGALLSLLLFPEPAASVAIYALAFGDGLSSLVGRLYGSIRIPLTGGKSIEGSATCFLAVLTASYGKTGNILGSLAVAFVAMIAEAAPTKDLDNLILPLAVGVAARFFLI